MATPFASTAHYSLLNALKQAGINPSDLELLDMQPDDIYAAWKRGDIDAAYVWNPVLGKLQNEGGVTITSGKKLSQEGVVTADLAAVRKDFAKQYPDIVVKYVKAQVDALEAYDKNPEESVEAIASVADISQEDAKNQISGFDYPDAEKQITDAYLGTKEKKGKLAKTLKDTADFLVKQGSIQSAPDESVFEDNITGEFVEQALGK